MNTKPRYLLLLLLPHLGHGWTLPISSFTTSTTTPSVTATPNLKNNRHTQLNARNPKRAYSKKNKKKGGTTKGKSSTNTNAGLKGFGSTTTSSTTSKISVPIDRSRSAMDFYSFLESRGAGTNLKRVALGFFPFDTNDKDTEKIVPKDGEGALRGVVALTKIQKGETIIEIPYEAAWNLGREGSDPTVPGVVVLDEYCRWKNAAAAAAATTSSRDIAEQDLQMGPYLEMLPPYRSVDVLGSTDFFSDAALEALQSPHIVQETLRRRDRTMERFLTDIEPPLLPSLTHDHDEQQQQQQRYQWTDGTSVTEEHLRWAVWLVTSRVLTVQGAAGTDESFRLMIPLIDMCNHDRDSSHVLTGRAVPGGSLKVVAGKTVEVGEQITIVYGGGVSGNDRFVQDYGFLDSGGGSGSSAGWGSIPEAYMITAKILMGTRRIFEGSGARNGRPTLMPLDERERALEALEETSLEDDLEILEREGEVMQADVKCAVEYRVGVKKALRALGHGLVMNSP